MNQDRFVGIYVDVLNATVSEAIHKNLVLQAQVKIADEEKAGLQKTLGEVTEQYKNAFQEKDRTIQELQSRNDSLRRERELQELENGEQRKNSQHIETFKSELTKARTEIEQLKTLVEQQRQMIVNLSSNKNKETGSEVSNEIVIEDDTFEQVKDAGNF